MLYIFFFNLNSEYPYETPLFSSFFEVARVFDVEAGEFVDPNPTSTDLQDGQEELINMPVLPAPTELVAASSFMSSTMSASSVPNT